MGYKSLPKSVALPLYANSDGSPVFDSYPGFVVINLNDYFTYPGGDGGMAILSAWSDIGSIYAGSRYPGDLANLFSKINFSSHDVGVTYAPINAQGQIEIWRQEADAWYNVIGVLYGNDVQMLPAAVDYSASYVDNVFFDVDISAHTGADTGTAAVLFIGQTSTSLTITYRAKGGSDTTTFQADAVSELIVPCDGSEVAEIKINGLPSGVQVWLKGYIKGSDFDFTSWRTTETLSVTGAWEDLASQSEEAGLYQMRGFGTGYIRDKKHDDAHIYQMQGRSQLQHIIGLPGEVYRGSAHTVYLEALITDDSPTDAVILQFPAPVFSGPYPVSIYARDATHVHTADRGAVKIVHPVPGRDATHAHTADRAAITQTQVPAIAESVHAHTADRPQKPRMPTRPTGRRSVRWNALRRRMPPTPMLPTGRQSVRSTLPPPQKPPTPTRPTGRRSVRWNALRRRIHSRPHGRPGGGQ
jgi:hypothetical protein